jgi:hypothetical protein
VTSTTGLRRQRGGGVDRSDVVPDVELVEAVPRVGHGDAGVVGDGETLVIDTTGRCGSRSLQLGPMRSRSVVSASVKSWRANRRTEAEAREEGRGARLFAGGEVAAEPLGQIFDRCERLGHRLSSG